MGGRGLPSYDPVVSTEAESFKQTQTRSSTDHSAAGLAIAHKNSLPDDYTRSPVCRRRKLFYAARSVLWFSLKEIPRVRHPKPALPLADYLASPRSEIT